MSEIKRVVLNTLETQKVSDKVTKKVPKTVRITLILPESNEDEYPEYNYKDELAAAVKKKAKPVKEPNSNCVENGLDPFGDNDDDVRRIALEMEAKYGSGVTKKKRKGRKDDYADIGMGYDESDPFIDNTDGYDEIIPQNVTTLHGGFYVNSGALVFKTDDEASSNASSSDSSSSDSSSSSESEGEDKQKSKNRKRILETSADSDSDTANPVQKEKKPKVQSAATTMQQAIQKKLFSTTKIQKVKKRRLMDPLKKTVKDLLREKREDLNMTVPDELKTVEDNIEKESSKENKKPMNITSVTDAIESVLKKVVQEEEELDNNNKNPTKPPPEGTAIPILPQNKLDSQQPQAKDKDNKPQLTRLEKEEMVKLPENLPADIEDLISKMKEAALNYKGEGKKAFFTKEVNAMLLNLEKRSKGISKSSRVKVYEHLSQYVNCTKDTLIRRARVLDLEDNERRLKGFESKLKDSIAVSMPALEEKFKQESEKILQKKFNSQTENNEDLKGLKLPRRKFVWSDETKKLLKDIVSLKKRCLTLEGKCKDNLLEEQIMDYLRKQIVPMWPEGWMYVNVVTKILNSMQDSKSSSSSSRSSQSSSSSAAAVKAVKHSNLSITPVTNGKTNADKPEITNSLTVTKVVNHSEADVAKKNHIIPDITIIKEKDERSSSSSYKDLEIITKHPSPPKVDVPKDVPADLSIHPSKTEIIDLGSDDSQFLEVNKVKPEQGKPLTYQKQPKQTEMFKPYADDISIERSIPDKPKISTYEEHRLPHTEIIPQVAQHVDHSYPNKDVTSGQSSYAEKTKQGVEKEKYSTHIFPIEEHISHSYTERDKRSPQSYADIEKQGAHIIADKEKRTNPDKEKRSSISYPDKDKYSSVSYSDKEKHASIGYPDKEKHISISYLNNDKVIAYQEKDKHSSVAYQEKDKHSSVAYQEKDKHSSIAYQEKDKHSSMAYLEKDKHSSIAYQEKDKHSSMAYQDKHSSMAYQDKDKHSSTAYQDKDKHSSIAYQDKDKHASSAYPDKDKYSSMAYPDKDKHSSHSYLEKEKHSDHVYADKEKHAQHSYLEKDKRYVEKDKHGSHGYVEKDKHGSHMYAEKDKHGSHGYVEKEKHGSHGYAEKDKDKHSSHSYLEKDKHSARSYSEKEKHSSHSYSSKDKHSSHSYSNKDKHSSHTYSDKDKLAALAYAAAAVQNSYIDKEKHSSQSYSSTKDKHGSHSYSDKERHVAHSYAADKDKHSFQPYPEKERHAHSTHSERDKHKKYEDKLLHLQERSSKLDNLLHNDKPANLSKQVDKPTDLSKFQMFKPYSETPKSHVDVKDLTKHHAVVDYKAKEDKHHRSMDIPKSMAQEAVANFTTKAYTTPSDFISQRYDVASSKHRTTNAHGFSVGNISNDIPQSKEDNGVIVKNIQPKDMTREDHHNPVIPIPAHCQPVKRKLMETYSRSSVEIPSPSYYPVAPSKHPEFSASTPLVNKSDGDGQQDIQMVMENLKALQKLSCSPVKPDTSASSPVSVISYNNKNFPSPKTTAAGLNLGRSDVNSRSEFPSGYQDDFQKQFINSLQQMAANAGSSKSSYNNGS